MQAEVLAAQERAALFDASSFGKIEVEGPDAEAFLLRVCAGHMDRAPGSVVYTAMLNERGTFESDLTAQRLTEDHYRLFVGTGAIKRDLAWLHRHSEGYDMRLTDSTEDYAVLGLMGPEAARIAAECGAPELNGLGYFKLGAARIAGHPVQAARLSYVGEPGWEITCRADDAPEVYAALSDAGATPAGLFAQTSMRIEKGFCAMGHELDSDTTPIDAGLGFATRKAGGFIGFEALQDHRARGAFSRIISLRFDDVGAVPIGHEPIYLESEIIGQTTSCAFGYRVGMPVALAHVSRQLADGTTVSVGVAGEMFAAKVTNGPLYDPDGRLMRG